MTAIDHQGFHVCDVHGGARLHDQVFDCPTARLARALHEADADAARNKQHQPLGYTDGVGFCAYDSDCGTGGAYSCEGPEEHVKQAQALLPFLKGIL